MSENKTFEEFLRKLHCSQTTFDELARWHWEDKLKIEQLKKEKMDLEIDLGNTHFNENGGVLK